MASLFCILCFVPVYPGAQISIFGFLISTLIHRSALCSYRFLRRTFFQLPVSVSSGRVDVEPTGAPAFRAFLRHRSTLVAFLRQAGRSNKQMKLLKYAYIHASLES